MGNSPSNQESIIIPERDPASHLSEIDNDHHASDRQLLILTLLGGCTLVALSIWLHQQDWMRDLRWITWVGLLAGLSLFLLSIRQIETNNTSSGLSRLLKKVQLWLDLKTWQVIALFISPVFALLAWLAAGPERQMNNPYVAILSWAFGIGLVTLSGWQFDQWRRSLTLKMVLLPLFLFLLALLVRGIYVIQIPIVLTGDEGSAGLSAVEFLKGNTNNIFRVGWFSFPALYFYIQSIPISLLGQTILAVRILSIIAGSLTVVGVYFVGCAMFGERTGLFSALFLASFHFHIHFSRIGLNNIWDSMWFVVVLGLLWAGYHYENRRLFILSGLALGFSQYFYISSRVLFFLLPTWLLVVGVVNPARLRRYLPSLLLMAAAALVTVLPLALYYFGNPDEFMAPMRRASVLGSWLINETTITGKSQFHILVDQLWTSLQAYAHQPLRAWYTPGVPLLRPLPAALFFLGVILLVLKIRDNRTTLLGMWLIVLTIMVALSESTPAAQRYVAVSPAVAILVGYGLAGSVDRLGKLWSRGMYLLNLIAVGIIIFIGLDDLRYYFLDYTPRSDFGGENTLVAHQLAEYLITQPDDLEVFFFGGTRMGYYSIPSLPFLAPHVKGIDINHPWSSPENPKPTSQNVLFVFLPDKHDELENIQSSYPGGLLMEVVKEDGKTLYWLYKYYSLGSLTGQYHLPSATRSPNANEINIQQKEASIESDCIPQTRRF
jgi:4-amino-4-deoxy-L-arabinose transferase-like glycosyltransferase